MARVVLAQIEFARAICGSRKILPMLVMVQVTQTTIFCKDNRYSVQKLAYQYL